MKNLSIYIILTLSPFFSLAQTAKTEVDNLVKQTLISVPFRLYPTQNMWTFLKLNTRNGQIRQIHYSMKSEERTDTYLNLFPLVNKELEINDRFALYPTQNIYNFILLDQIDGKTWQVQWSFEPESRVVVPIE